MINPKDLPRIYLDTNHWIELARIAQGKNNDPSCKKLYSDLVKLINSNDILIPFSSYVFFEIIKYRNQQNREQMIDFLVDISKGWFFKPIEKYFRYEILNSCYKKLGSTKYYNLFSQLLTNRADSIIGGNIGKAVPREGHNPSLELQSEVQKKWDDAMVDPVWMKKVFKDEILRTYANYESKIMEDFAKKIEVDRNNTFGVSDVIFDRYTKVKWVMKLFIHDFAKFLYENQIPREEFFENKNEFESLIENMPALNVFVELSYVRDKESKERPVKRNDYYDICHFATGLPYANVMVGERMFSNLSKRQKLDQKNECVLFSSLNEMAEFDIHEILHY